MAVLDTTELMVVNGYETNSFEFVYMLLVLVVLVDYNVNVISYRYTGVHKFLFCITFISSYDTIWCIIILS